MTWGSDSLRYIFFQQGILLCFFLKSIREEQTSSVVVPSTSLLCAKCAKIPTRVAERSVLQSCQHDLIWNGIQERKVKTKNKIFREIRRKTECLMWLPNVTAMSAVFCLEFYLHETLRDIATNCETQLYANTRNHIWAAICSFASIEKDAEQNPPQKQKHTKEEAKKVRKKDQATVIVVWNVCWICIYLFSANFLQQVLRQFRGFCRTFWLLIILNFGTTARGNCDFACVAQTGLEKESRSRRNLQPVTIGA